MANDLETLNSDFSDEQIFDELPFKVRNLIVKTLNVCIS